MEALKGVMGFLAKRQENYVVLSDCDGVARLNISDILEYHEEKNADITMVTHYEEVEKAANLMLVESDKDGRVNEVKINPRVRGKAKANVYINVMVFNFSISSRTQSRTETTALKAMSLPNSATA